MGEKSPPAGDGRWACGFCSARVLDRGARGSRGRSVRVRGRRRQPRRQRHCRNRLEQLRAHDLDRHGAEPDIQQDGSRLDLPRARGRAEDERRHRVRGWYQAGRQLRLRDRRVGAEQGRPQARLHGDRDRRRARLPQPRLGPDPAEHDLLVGARRVRVQQGHLRQLRRSRRARQPHRGRHADRLRLRRRRRHPGPHPPALGHLRLLRGRQQEPALLGRGDQPDRRRLRRGEGQRRLIRARRDRPGERDARGQRVRRSRDRSHRSCRSSRRAPARASAGPSRSAAARATPARPR